LEMKSKSRLKLKLLRRHNINIRNGYQDHPDSRFFQYSQVFLRHTFVECANYKCLRRKIIRTYEKC
jgi:hypothetical protein